jgi:peptidoglycan/xylan/chitin deacetylase (PgdA/CDA1 family)
MLPRPRRIEWANRTAIGAEGGRGRPGARHPPWDSVGYVARAGLEGADLEQEIQRSARRVEHEVGQAVLGFSYPFGRFDSIVRAQVREAGPECAVADLMG